MTILKNNLFINIVIFYLTTISIIHGSAVKKIIDEVEKYPIQIQGYSPSISDDYVAFVVDAPNGYITKFEPLSKAERVHHMILYGCGSISSKTLFWRGFETCGPGKSSILFAWARNAPSFELPEGVAFAIGDASNGINYLVLQIHYADPFQGNVKDFSGLMIHIDQRRPKYLADVFLFAGVYPIPPRMYQYQQNMSCTYKGNTPIYPFAFRVHTHKMGRVVSGYFKHDNKWTQIGKRNPQWPQLFQKIGTKMEINNGDLLAASCRFDSSNEITPTNMGHMGKDEMCNFYMMYYRRTEDEEPFPYGGGCAGQERYNEMLKEYPKNGVDLLPPNPLLEAIAAPSKIRFGVIPKEKITHIDGNTLGQISGLALDNRNNLAVFHRGSREWNQYTFDFDHVIKNQRPIPEPTILILSTSESGFSLVHALGEDMFYMPHGIFIDESNYIYVTDVGSHQVHKMKINSNGKLEIIFSIGEKFVPGKDREHFCQPSAVAVSKYDGSIYITDGYCNSRVVKFSKDGRYIKEFGTSGRNLYGNYAALGSFQLPHDISIDDENNKLYVSDRENGRVQVFDSDGNPLYDIKDGTLFTNVYSAHYCKDHGLFLVPGLKGNTIFGDYAFVAPTNSSVVQYAFAPIEGLFNRPHIIRAKGDYVYIGEIAEGRGKLWKFEIESDHLLKSTTISSEEITQYPGAETSSIKETIPKSSGGILIFALISFAILIAGFFGYKTLKHKKIFMKLLTIQCH
uniref:Peptidylglycine monooxygenase n=1 Tax=Strongyloides stercoralis TaxID=6248 RepID=A0A0K0E1E1_STRER